MIDLSHLNEKGFWDVARLSDAPLVATHSNVHAICPHSRNLTDRQLAAIRESRGMVGVNFATAFIRADGRRDANTTLEDLIRHVDHLVAHVGVDHVGFGSDFDGATIPAAIGDAARPAPPRRRDAPARLRRGSRPQDRLGQLARPPGADLGRLRAASPLPACGERVSAFGRNQRSEAKRG